MLLSKYRKLTPEELQNRITEGALETVIVAFTDHYGRLLGKRVDAEYFLAIVMNDGTHACDYVLTTDMEMDPIPGYEFASWELGYGDFHLTPDLTTLRVADWLDKTAIVIANVDVNETHAPVTVAPRSILNSVLDKMKEESGYVALAATELEYYLFENTYREAFDKKYHDLKPAGYYIEDYHLLQGTRCEKYTGAVRRHLKRSGIIVENSKGEWGLGQHEINLRYSTMLASADNHILFKQCAKEVADKMGLAVTFMAKPHTDQAGSSSHIHISLSQNDTNIFDGDETLGPVKCSSLFRWFLGGWIAHTNEVMPFYAPTVNSYKRFVDGSWAPTRLAWSYDNRTAAFRVVGSGKSLRIECRIPGADCNPYLALAASLASGLDGIKNQIEPPACFEGDIYAANKLPRVPYTLAEAIPAFEQSDFIKSTFGEEVQKHYVHFFKTEVKAYEQSVTDWERKRYFEQI